jgi:hypothetical protein
VSGVPVVSPVRDALPGGSEQPFVVGQAEIVPSRPPGAVTLAETVAAGLFPTIGAARKAAQRGGCGAPVGNDGTAHLYDLTAIYAHRADKVKVLR